MQDKSDYERFFSELNLKDDLKIEEDLGNGFVRLKISEADRRQALQDIKCVEDIVVELLRNSRDAGSKNIFVATKKIADKKRLIYCIDDGQGIPAIFHDLIFQSRVTSKLDNGIRDPYGFHGRGMALFSIKLNVEDINITYSALNRGTCIFIEIDLDKLSEKKDQSALPDIVKKNKIINISGGVKNIIRTITEFAAENENIDFYLGSPTQIISTIRDLLNDRKTKTKDFKRLNILESYFDKNDLKLIDLPGLTDNYNLLGILLKKYFNIDLSDRSLQRIIYDRIDKLEPLNNLFNDTISSTSNVSYVDRDKSENKKKSILKLYDELKLSHRFKDEEISYIIELVKKEFEKLGNKYFIKVDDEVEFKKQNNTIDIKINLKQKD